MQTAAMVLESRSDPVCYKVGIDETAFVQLWSSPASIVMASASTPASGSMRITVSNAGAMVYTPSPPLVRGDPDRIPISTRNVQRRNRGEIVLLGETTAAVATVTLLLRAETRYIKFGGWGDPWGDGLMSLYSATNQWSYNPLPGFTGLNAVSSSLTGMAARLNDPMFTTVEGQISIGSGRGGGPGSMQLKTGNQQLAFWHNPCRIQMTSANGVLWNITPGAGGALTPAPA
jgi:hypothetical protein